MPGSPGPGGKGASTGSFSDGAGVLPGDPQRNYGHWTIFSDRFLEQTAATRPDPRLCPPFPTLSTDFKHSLIQEVVYNGLLRNQRTDIHDRVGLALERFFSDKSLEDWETLAYHFKNGHDVCRAVDYLMKSGEKSLKRYALEEANQYFKEAYEILSGNQARSKGEDIKLMELLMRWCLVFYYQGRFEGMSEMLLAQPHLAESSGDKARIGAYHAWLGHAVFWKGAGLDASRCYLHRALALGEDTGGPASHWCCLQFPH